jgi:hypothetical protein
MRVGSFAWVLWSLVLLAAAGAGLGLVVAAVLRVWWYG